jgi:hypothetical protein
VLRDKKARTFQVVLGKNEDVFAWYGDGDLEFSVPDIEDLDIVMPHLRMDRGKAYRFHDWDGEDDQLSDQMDQLQEELDQLRQELKELKKELNK